MKVAIIYRVNSENLQHKPVFEMLVQNALAWENDGHHTDTFYVKGQSIVKNNESIISVTLLSNLFFYEKLKSVFKNHDYDLVIVLFSAIAYGHESFGAYLKREHPNTKTVLEIQTYPYIYEYPLHKRWLAWALSPNSLQKGYNGILHLGPESSLFDVPTIASFNGIDAKSIPSRKYKTDSSTTLRLLLVAGLWPWHETDKLMLAIKEYNESRSSSKIKLTIVGDGPFREDIQRIIHQEQLGEVIKLLPPAFGADLDTLFDQHDIAVGNIAVAKQRKGYCQSLKHRHYAARGIPFFFNTRDEKFVKNASTCYLDNPNIDMKMLEKVFSWFQENFAQMEKLGIELHTFAHDHLTWSQNVQSIKATLKLK